MTQHSWRGQVEEQLSGTVQGVRPLSGGCIGEVYAVDLADGRRVVVKVDDSAQPKLDIEGYMLQYLAQHSALPVPAVHHSDAALLVMDFLPGDSHFGADTQGHAAELFAALHACTPPKTDCCGLERDTLIGALHQPNPWTAGWLVFFAEHRVLYMARAALAESRIDKAMMHRLERFCENLDRFLAEPAHPSLLHGDAWTTNMLAQKGQMTAFLDPAIYYGHPEIELAFTTLFGTFGKPFFERYNALRPIAPGFFEERCAIYNLYPLLVHVRLFGSGYLNGVDSTLRRLGF